MHQKQALLVDDGQKCKPPPPPRKELETIVIQGRWSCITLAEREAGGNTEATREEETPVRGGDDGNGGKGQSFCIILYQQRVAENGKV
jgi:hypothetical protein